MGGFPKGVSRRGYIPAGEATSEATVERVAASGWALGCYKEHPILVAPINIYSGVRLWNKRRKQVSGARDWRTRFQLPNSELEEEAPGMAVRGS